MNNFNKTLPHANQQLTIIIPCYNEAGNIPKVMPEVIAYCEKNNWNLIVVLPEPKADQMRHNRSIEFIKFINGYAWLKIIIINRAK